MFNCFKVNNKIGLIKKFKLSNVQVVNYIKAMEKLIKKEDCE